MESIKPWGRLEYLLQQTGVQSWRCFATSSFEDRCATVPSRLRDLGVLRSLGVLEISPPSDALNREVCQQLVERASASFAAFPNVSVHKTGLLDPLSSSLEWMARSLTGDSSVVLDISAMPKRFFMLLVNKLMDNAQVKDLVVTYAKPSSYPEGALAVDHDPVSSLTGFMREDDSDGETMSIIGAGFVQFSLSEYLEQAQGSEVSILLPFPPGSPSSRRNWNLMHRMDPNIEMRAEIRRIHSLDFFHALRWMNGVVDGCTAPKINFIPLGPKPHSLAMALAFRRAPSRASVLYAQPHSYRPDYSLGVALGENGLPDVHAYCLKRDFIAYA